MPDTEDPSHLTPITIRFRIYTKISQGTEIIYEDGAMHDCSAAAELFVSKR